MIIASRFLTTFVTMVILFLNSIAGSEIVIILLFVLIFFGAKSIPGMSRTLGRGIRQIKDASQEVQNEIRKTTSDMRTEMNVKRTIDKVAEEVKEPFKDFSMDIENSTSALQDKIQIKGGVPHQKKQTIANKKVEDKPENRSTLSENKSSSADEQIKTK